MDKEIEALEVTNTWSLVPLPLGESPIGCKWVYRLNIYLMALLKDIRLGWLLRVSHRSLV